MKKDREDEKSKELQTISFRIDDQAYGIDIMEASEIISIQKIHDYPKCPDFIEGIYNLRGRIIPIIDLKKRLKNASSEKQAKRRVIIANINQDSRYQIGLIVDEVCQVIRCRESDIFMQPAVLDDVNHKFIRGLINHNDQLIILLLLDDLFSKPEKEAIVQTTNINVR